MQQTLSGTLKEASVTSTKNVPLLPTRLLATESILVMRDHRPGGLAFHILATTGQISDCMWGNELPGGGLISPRAFFFFLVVNVFEQESTHQTTVTTTIIYLEEGSLAAKNNVKGHFMRTFETEVLPGDNDDKKQKAEAIKPEEVLPSTRGLELVAQGLKDGTKTPAVSEKLMNTRNTPCDIFAMLK